MIERVIGEIVGNYRIVSKLSVGGMGTVYRAEHAIIGKHAAVKVLRPELSTNHDIVNRFLKEAQATTTIKHPGIVDVIDFGYMPSGHAFLVMEFLEGMSLAQRLEQHGAMSEGEAAMLLRYVCAALAAAHAKGIVHRDLKPDNIFMVPDPESAIGERPTLLDFGIAKLTDVGLAGTATKTGAVMGTPTYMSPEQCRGTGEVDHRADLYSIGCIYYELVTGRPPFIDEGAGELIGAHLYLEPERPSLHLPGLCPETEALIMALLHKRPDHRPQTAKELGQRLTVIAQRHGWITASSPTGITASALPELDASGTRALPPRPAATASTSQVAGGDAPARPAAVEPTSVGKPTTLSGAASQSVIGVARRSRWGLAIAMLAVAGVAAGAIAFATVDGTESTAKPAAATPARATPRPSTPTPPQPATDLATPKPAATAVEPPRPAADLATPVEPSTADLAKPAARPAIAKPAVGPAIAKPAAGPAIAKKPPRPRAPRLQADPPEPRTHEPKKPEPKKPDKPEPKKPTLIETDID